MSTQIYFNIKCHLTLKNVNGNRKKVMATYFIVYLFICDKFCQRERIKNLNIKMARHMSPDLTVECSILSVINKLLVAI